MATSSFDRDFVIKDKKGAERFLRDLNNPKKEYIFIKNRDEKKEEERRFKLLERLKKLHSV